MIVFCTYIHLKIVTVRLLITKNNSYLLNLNQEHFVSLLIVSGIRLIARHCNGQYVHIFVISSWESLRFAGAVFYMLDCITLKRQSAESVSYSTL